MRHLGITRRMLGQGALGLGACAMLGGVGRALADGPPTVRLVFCELEGGWDVLLGPDARDPARTYAGIDLGADALAPEDREPVVVSGPSGSFLCGAPMAELVARHADVMTVIRGVNVGTVAHPTARSYMATGLAPGGANARGSSLGAALASGYLDASAAPVLPFVALGSPAYNDRYAEGASPISLVEPADLVDLLSVRRSTLPGSIESALVSARASERACLGHDYLPLDPSTGAVRVTPAVAFDEARRRLAMVDRESYASHFDFAADPTATALYGEDVTRSVWSPALAAASAARLLTSGLAVAVSARVQQGIDQHRDWAADHPPLLRVGFDAVAAMLTDLREDAGLADPNLERTIVVVHSEFARTPRLNGTSGRDHWFTGAVLVFGGRMPRGVFGATGEEDLSVVRVDPATGARSDAADAIELVPEHVYASIARAADLPTDVYRVEPPGFLRT